MLRVVLYHLAGSKLDPQDDLAACNVVNRMIQGFGYCPHCVGPALAYLARKTK